MPRPTKLFSDRTRQEVEDAIFDAEQKTGAEIVVVVAARSGGYQRVADVFGLSVAVAVTLVLMWVYEGPPSGALAHLVFPSRTHLHPAVILAVMVGVFALFAAIADTNPALVRAVAGKARLRRHVERMGPSWFQRLRVRRTQDRVGVMIYISLLEHMVEIFPDDAFESMLAEHRLEPVRERIKRALDAGRLPAELAGAIAEAGEILAQALPSPKKNMDELSNELHLID